MRLDGTKGSLADSGFPIHPGDVLGGKYRLERLLGEGGMGMVFVGRHVSVDEPVAVKVLHPRRAFDPQVLTRFLREAKMGFKLRSEHVVRTLDVGTHPTPSGTLPYIVMELLDGEELGRRIDGSGAVPVADAVDLMLQACEALASAHALGIVHRDLKPSNLFLVQGPDGKPFLKVLDFGISKVNDVSLSGQGVTTTDAVLGSPGYMPPEQLRASRDVDARSDIWSLAMVLWEMLVGKPMFGHATFPEICAKVLQGSLPTPGQAGVTLPDGLEAVLTRALSTEPEDRHPTVLAFAEALAPYLGEHPAPRLLRIKNLSKPPAERGSSIPPEPLAMSVASTATSHPPPPMRTSSTTSVPWGVTDAGTNSSKQAREVRRRGRAIWIAVGLAMVATVALTMAALSRPRAEPDSASSPSAPPTMPVLPLSSSPPSAPPSVASAAPQPPPTLALPSSATPPRAHTRVVPRASTELSPPPSSSSSARKPANGAPILW